MNIKRVTIKATVLAAVFYSYDVWGGCVQIWMQSAMVIPV